MEGKLFQRFNQYAFFIILIKSALHSLPYEFVIILELILFFFPKNLFDSTNLVIYYGFQMTSSINSILICN